MTQTTIERSEIVCEILGFHGGAVEDFSLLVIPQGNWYTGTQVSEHFVGCVCLIEQEKATWKMETSPSETFVPVYQSTQHHNQEH